MTLHTSLPRTAAPPDTARAPGRSLAVDLLKTVAIADVVLSHVAVPTFASAPVGTPLWLCSLFFASISHISVSLFLMCSGALLLRSERMLTLRKLYTKNFPRLLAALLFWAMGYQIFGLLASGTFTAPALWQAVKSVLLFHHEEHLYYLHIMLLVYAFLPVTRLLTAHASRRELWYFLGLWFLLGILYPTVKCFWPFTLLRGIPVQYLMNMTYASVGYTVLGCALAREKLKKRTGALLAAAGFAIAFGGSLWMSLGKGGLDTHFLEGMTVGMCLLGAGVYILGLRVRLPELAGRLVTYVSKASFCIFLVHIFFLKGFAHLGLTAAIGPSPVTVPLLAALLLACGCGVYALLSRIPLVRDYLV